MTLTEIIIGHIEWVVTIVFLAGGGWVTLRTIRSDLDKNEKHLNAKFDSMSRSINKRFDRLDDIDRDHTDNINELKVTVARHEEKLSVLDDLKQMVQDIWKRAMSNGDKNE